jgi:hypothetical protein
MRPSQVRTPAAGEDRLRPEWDKGGQFWAGLEEASRFFRGEAAVQRATEKIVRLLEQNGIPYAILGGMALNAYGFIRVTVDVDLLLNAEGLEAFKAIHPEPTELGVRIHVFLAGRYPGDGCPKPVAYPDPVTAAVRGEKMALLPLPRLLELKLASGMTAPHRLKDLADVLEVIRMLKLPAELVEKLDPYVREKYRELWQAAQIHDPEQDF